VSDDDKPARFYTEAELVAVTQRAKDALEAALGEDIDCVRYALVIMGNSIDQGIGVRSAVVHSIDVAEAADQALSTLHMHTRGLPPSARFLVPTTKGVH
jgi:hypothetical protein